MKIQSSPRKRRALIRHLADFPKTIAFEHDNRVLGRRVGEAKFDEVFPQLTRGLRVQFLERNGPCRFSTAFVLTSVKSCVDLIVGNWSTLVIDRSEVEERSESFFGG